MVGLDVGLKVESKMVGLDVGADVKFKVEFVEGSLDEKHNWNPSKVKDSAE